MSDSHEIAVRISQKRWSREVARNKKKKEFRRSNQKTNKVSRQPYISRILNLFDKDFVPFKKRNITSPKGFELPRKFSLTANAEETLATIKDIVRYARSARRPRLLLDHRAVKELGLGAEALLAVVLKEITLEATGIQGAYIKGYKAKDAKVRRIMDEIGSVRVLGSGVDEDIKVSLKSSPTVFRHQNRGKDLKVDALTSDPISQTTRDFSDHLDSCLKLIGKRLSPRGRDRLLAYVAEVLINAQEHSGTAQWVIVGFVDEEDENLMYRAAIFSLGTTIDESFESLDKTSYAWGVVEPYISRHEKSGFFGPTWTKSNLLNVVALQGNVSSKLDGPLSDRGQGTVDLIEFFQNISKECAGVSDKPVMSIISGGTHIAFDGTYRMKFEQEQDRMIIAFNSDNNLLLPPDKKFVRAMDSANFPGVMISIAVPLARGTVEEIPMENGNES